MVSINLKGIALEQSAFKNLDIIKNAKIYHNSIILLFKIAMYRFYYFNH